MSNRNSLVNKAEARQLRANRAINWTPFARTALSAFPKDAARDLICDPKLKLSAAKRKKYSRAFQSRVEVPRIEPGDPLVKLVVKLNKAPLRTVLRTLTRSARRAATLKYLAAAAKDTKFHQPLLNAQSGQLAIFRQADAELKARYNHATTTKNV